MVVFTSAYFQVVDLGTEVDPVHITVDFGEDFAGNSQLLDDFQNFAEQYFAPYTKRQGCGSIGCTSAPPSDENEKSLKTCDNANRAFKTQDLAKPNAPIK